MERRELRVREGEVGEVVHFGAGVEAVAGPKKA